MVVESQEAFQDLHVLLNLGSMYIHWRWSDGLKVENLKNVVLGQDLKA